MGVLVREIPGMTPETKDRVMHEEFERKLGLFAKELRELREKVKALEDKK